MVFFEFTKTDLAFPGHGKFLKVQFDDLFFLVHLFGACEEYAKNMFDAILQLV